MENCGGRHRKWELKAVQGHMVVSAQEPLTPRVWRAFLFADERKAVRGEDLLVGDSGSGGLMAWLVVLPRLG